jgi:hypothetical protein
MSQPHFGQSVRMRLTLPKVGTWSPPGLPQLQRSIVEGKKPCLEELFIPLEGSWSVDVQNGLAWTIWTSIAQVMGKTTKSWESTSSQRLQKECNGALESFRGEPQLWFKPHSDQRSEPGDMTVQSPRSLTRDSFGTPPWESQEKVPFGCGPRRVMQKILCGGRWWLPPSPGRGDSNESKVARGLSQHRMDAEWVLTNLGLVLDAGSCNNIIVPLLSLTPGLLACPSYPL